MKAELRFNICGLESSFVLDRDVEDIDNRIEKNISATLVYACRYWANHFELTAGCDLLLRELEEFYSVRLLFWMEVLSLKRDMRQGVISLMKANRLLKLVYSADPQLLCSAEDAYDFATSYAANPVSQSTPHIYTSALPFCPRISQVYKRYSKLMTGLLDVGHCIIGCGRTSALAIWHQKIGVLSVAYSPNGDWIAFGFWDGTVEIRDAHTGLLTLGPVQCHDSWVFSITFSPDSSKFATGSWCWTTRVWDAVDGTPIGDPFLGHTSLITSAAFSPNGTIIIPTAWDLTVRTSDLSNGKMVIGDLVVDLRLPVVFSPDGSRIAIRSADEDVLLWAMEAPLLPVATLKGHTLPVTALVFSPDSRRLVSGSNDGFIRIWDVAERTLLRAIDCCTHIQSLTNPTELSRINADIASVDVSPKGKWIVTGSADETVRVWDIDDGTLVAGPFTGHWGFSLLVSFSPDGARVASCAEDRSIRLWSVREGMLASTHDSRMFDITSITFSPSGSRIYTTSPYGVSLWNANDGSLVSNVTSARPRSACSLPISHDGTRIAVFLEDHSVQVISIKDRSRIAGPFRGHTALATCAAFSADGLHLVTGSEDCTLRMWSFRDGGSVAGPFVGHTKTIVRVSVSRDGSRVASYSLDGTIRVWNTRSNAMKVDVGSSSLSEGHSEVLGGWTAQEDGWVTNGEGQLLFWIPLDFPCKLVPETEVVITQFGSFSVPKHKLLVGEAWKQCYVID